MQVSLLEPVHAGVRVDDDAGDGQQLRHLAGGLRAEDRKRGVLERDEVQLGVDAHLEGALGEHQRELVERKRPGAARWGDERDARRVAAFDVLDEPVHRLRGVERAVERGHPAQRCNGHGAGGDDEDVVGDLLAVGGLHGVGRAVDARQGAQPVFEARVGGDARERVVDRAPGGEGLEHAQRAVVEVPVGRQHGGDDALARDPMQRQRGFERSGAGAGDEDVEGHEATLGPRGRPGVRENAAPAA